MVLPWRVDCSNAVSTHGHMKNVLLLFLLSLAGNPESHSASAVEPAASIRTAAEAPTSSIGVVEEVLGAWRGEWRRDDADAPLPVDIVFAPGIRPRTVFAYVTFLGPNGERTIRRPARLTDVGLELAVPGRWDLVLRADGDTRLIAPGLVL